MPLNKHKLTLLLHVCCAPCATAVIEKLLPDYDLVLCFLNPNIQPMSEYLKRQEEVLKLAKITGQQVLLGGDDFLAWQQAVRGLENEPEGGKRCAVCIDFRLNQCAELAAEQNYLLFATTLSVSPHKNLDQIEKAGQRAASKHGVKYLSANFKKADGYKRSLELSKQHSLYRQNYCGCLYAKNG